MQEITLRLSTRGTPCGFGKYGDIFAIWASDNKNKSLIGYTTLDEAIESALNSLGKQINKA